eukprot:s392_g15.t1
MSDFQGLRLQLTRCSHDITDRYFLELSPQQWAFAVSGASSVVCLQAFVFADTLDVSSCGGGGGGGVMPTPESRSSDPRGLMRVIELFCGGFSGWTHVSQMLSTFNLPLETALAVDNDPVYTLTYHRTFGAQLVDVGLSVQLDDGSTTMLAWSVGIIGHEFNVTWQKRAEMLLKTRLRNALAKWGYSFTDVEHLFDFADADADGHLQLGEFIELIRQMRIGVSVETAAKLFHFVDNNEDGFIDRHEFIRNIFPDEYAKHTQQIQDESFSRSKRRIGVALERLDSGSRSSQSSTWNSFEDEERGQRVSNVAAKLSDLPEGNSLEEETLGQTVESVEDTANANENTENVKQKSQL